MSRMETVKRRGTRFRDGDRPSGDGGGFSVANAKTARESIIVIIIIITHRSCIHLGELSPSPRIELMKVMKTGAMLTENCH
jgi:hypothetical protein